MATKTKYHHCAHVAEYYRNLADQCIGKNAGLYLYIATGLWIKNLKDSGGKL